MDIYVRSVYLRVYNNETRAISFSFFFYTDNNNNNDDNNTRLSASSGRSACIYRGRIICVRKTCVS